MPKAIAVTSSDLARHGNWSPALHRSLATTADEPDQLDAFWKLMTDNRVERRDVEHALLQAKTADAAVLNVIELILKRSTGGVTYDQFVNISALTRKLADIQLSKEGAKAHYHAKRAGHLRKNFTPESVVTALLGRLPSA